MLLLLGLCAFVYSVENGKIQSIYNLTISQFHTRPARFLFYKKPGSAHSTKSFMIHHEFRHFSILSFLICFLSFKCMIYQRSPKQSCVFIEI